MSIVNVNQFICASFPFGFDGGIWDPIALIPDHCVFIHFTKSILSKHSSECFFFFFFLFFLFLATLENSALPMG